MRVEVIVDNICEATCNEIVKPTVNSGLLAPPVDTLQRRNQDGILRTSPSQKNAFMPFCIAKKNGISPKRQVIQQLHLGI